MDPDKTPTRVQAHGGSGSEGNGQPVAGSLPAAPDLPGLTQLSLNPEPPLADYRVAMATANSEATARLGEHMLLSWYDRDRDFESPQHASECHQSCAVPGYVDYALHRGATLKIDVEDGRFVFFYVPLDF